MGLVLQRRVDIDLAAFEGVAWRGERIRLHGSAVDRMEACRRGFLGLLDSDPEVVVYGVTSGYGQRAHERFTPAQRREHARNPPFGPMTAFGDPLPERTVRGIVLARLANFLEGHAAVSPALAKAVAGMLDAETLPEVPTGGIGSAGEILPLSHLFGPLADRFPLAEKEALALINGSPVSAALAADAALAGRRRLALAEQVFALSIEALCAPLEAYDAALDELWGDPDEARALGRLRDWLDGAEGARRPYQAPVSWRILPRVLGQAHRAQRQLEEVAERSLAAVTDNPVYLAPDSANPLGRVISNGGYHNARVYPALDALTAVHADLALLCDRHVTKLLDGRVSRLPHQLQAGEGYLGCLGFTSAGFAEQARRAAQPTLLPGSEGGGFGQNDVAVPVFHAWRQHQEAADCLEAALAALAAVCSQALHVTGRAPAPPLREGLATVRRFVPPVVESRPLGEEVAALAACWRSGIKPADG